MGKNTFNGELLMRKMSIVPSGAMKMDALKEAIRQAENIQMPFLYQYIAKN